MKGIYVIKDRETLAPVYVGQSKNIFSRWGDHLTLYPYDQYRFEVLEILSGDMKLREQHWINEMNTYFNGDNKTPALSEVKTKTPRESKYPEVIKNMPYENARVLWLYTTLEKESCQVCGDPTQRYLQWFPHHKKIRNLAFRYGAETPQRKEANQLVDESIPVCQNCIIDRDWGEEKAPWPF